MSDITPELIEERKQHDARIRIIEEGFAISAEMRDSPTIRYLLRRITTDADNAMEELAEISPLNSEAISALLVRIRAYVYIRRSLLEIKQRAEVAAQSVEQESHLDTDVGDYGT